MQCRFWVFYRFYNDYETFVVSAVDSMAGEHVGCESARHRSCCCTRASRVLLRRTAGWLLAPRRPAQPTCCRPVAVLLPSLHILQRLTCHPRRTMLLQFGHAAHLDHELHEEEHGSHDDKH